MQTSYLEAPSHKFKAQFQRMASDFVYGRQRMGCPVRCHHTEFVFTQAYAGTNTIVNENWEAIQ